MRRWGEYIFFALLAFAIGALSHAVVFADDDLIVVKIRMTKEKYEMCQKVGCAVLTPADVNAAYEKGKAEGVQEWIEENIDFHGCRKNEA